MTAFSLSVMVVKVIFVAVVLLTTVPIMAWVERRGSALIQNRLGPNRVGPLGLIQPLADVVKFLWKEDPVPAHVSKTYYVLAPLMALVPAFMTFAVIPFAGPIQIGERVITFQAADLNVGLLYIFSIASLGIYGIIMSGWSSNNKFSLLGSLRSSSQMISYEVSMGLSIIGIVMAFSSIDLGEIVSAQGQALSQIGGFTVPKWGIFIQPLGFVIFLTTLYAETNRLPFDLPEGESEIIAGYHLEYGSIKFAMFFMAEYMNMFTASGLLATLYFGGWQLLPGMGWLLGALPLTGMSHDWARVILEMTSFFLKVGFFMWLFVWVRWTLPRFRYDQLMDFGWKVLLPLSMANICVTTLIIYFGWV
ncbi:MAG: NADH-quinone oxidoreductase subunit NuoH [Candidatus Poribacteria bacterium]